VTKHVRIENADTSDYNVLVQTWDKGLNGAPDILVMEELLEYPCQMTRPNETYIHSTRYLVVKEA
jgi:hypothetical protein